MKQSFVSTQVADVRMAIDPNDLLARALREVFASIGMAIEHGEFYAHPTHPMISGWRQQRLDLSTYGQWVEYDIKLRVGSAHDPHCVNPVMRAEAVVDDGIDQ